jgi:light-regulated signal transduction histidine kinase (bacteriophytochrome)
MSEGFEKLCDAYRECCRNDALFSTVTTRYAQEKARAAVLAYVAEQDTEYDQLLAGYELVIKDRERLTAELARVREALDQVRECVSTSRVRYDGQTTHERVAEIVAALAPGDKL